MGFPIVAVLVSGGVSIALGQLRPKVQKPKPQDLEGWKAEEGRVLDYVGGIAAVEGNVTWWGDVRISGEDLRPAYNANLVMRLCQGPIDQILDLQAGGKSIRFQSPGRDQSSNLETYVIDPALPYTFGAEDVVDFDINARQMFGGDLREGGLEKRVRVYRGALNQSTIDELTAHSWEAAGLEATTGSAYPGACYAAFGRISVEDAEFYLGTIAQPKPFVFILTRYPRGLRDLGLEPGYTDHVIGFDSNPAELIYELCLDSRLGLGMVPTALDLPSFARAAALWQEEQLGQTVHLTRREKGKGIIDELLKAVDATLTPHPTTGLLTLTPLRNDYVLEDLLTVTDDAGGANAWNLEEVTPLARDSYNRVQANYRRFAGGTVGPVENEVLSPSYHPGEMVFQTKGRNISNVVLRIGDTTLTPAFHYEVTSAAGGYIVILRPALLEELAGEPVVVDYVSNPDTMRFEEAHVTEDLLGDQQLTGEIRPLELELPYTTSDLVAAKIAARTKLRVGRNLKQYRWKMNRSGYALFPGAVCKITSVRLGLTDFPVRVGDVDQGTLQDPTIEVIAVEDIWAQDVSPQVPSPPGGPDGVRPRAPAMAIGCGIGGEGVARIALFPSDTLYDVEVWEADDEAGTGATLVETIDGATDPMFYDGTVGKYYQARQVQPAGLASPGPFTPWITCAEDPNPPTPPTCAPLTYLVDPRVIEDVPPAGAGEVELVVTDTQNRLREVRFRTRSGGGAWSEWTPDTAAPYSTQVLRDPTFPSRIEWEIDTQACDGTEVTLEGGYDFIPNSPPPPDPDPPGTGAGGESVTPIVLFGVDIPRVFWGITEERMVIGVQDKIPLGPGFVRVVVTATESSLPATAYVAAEFELIGELDGFVPLDSDPDRQGPTLAVGASSVAGFEKRAREGGWVPVPEEAWGDVRLRATVGGGDADVAKRIGLTRVELQYSRSLPGEEEPPETEPLPPPENPGSCEIAANLDTFAYANQAALDAAWPEV